MTRLGSKKTQWDPRALGYKAGEHLRVMCMTIGRPSLELCTGTELFEPGSVYFLRGEHVVALSEEEHTRSRGGVSGALLIQALTERGVFWFRPNDLERSDHAAKVLGEG